MNDELLSVFEKYDRYMANRDKSVASSSSNFAASASKLPQSTQSPTKERAASHNLIDLNSGENPPPVAQPTPTALAPIGFEKLNQPQAEKPFDMFEQTRQTTMEQERKG